MAAGTAGMNAELKAPLRRQPRDAHSLANLAGLVGAIDVGVASLRLLLAHGFLLLQFRKL